MLVCLLHRKGRAGFSLDENQGLARCSGLIYLANVRYWIPEMVDFTPLQNALLADLPAKVQRQMTRSWTKVKTGK